VLPNPDNSCATDTWFKLLLTPAQKCATDTWFKLLLTPAQKWYMLVPLSVEGGLHVATHHVNCVDGSEHLRLIINYENISFACGDGKVDS
jgi:hypothetical protein